MGDTNQAPAERTPEDIMSFNLSRLSGVVSLTASLEQEITVMAQHGVITPDEANKAAIDLRSACAPLQAAFGRMAYQAMSMGLVGFTPKPQSVPEVPTAPGAEDTKDGSQAQ